METVSSDGLQHVLLQPQEVLILQLSWSNPRLQPSPPPAWFTGVDAGSATCWENSNKRILRSHPCNLPREPQQGQRHIVSQGEKLQASEDKPL